jgi:hypothetical protein
VKVEAHYSSGDSTRNNQQFVRDVLYPAYRNVEEIVDLEIVPFGQTEVTEVDGNYTFTCPNGPNECTGNLIHVRNK